MRSVAAAALLGAVAGLAACGKASPPEVRVFAASSLTDVLGRLAPVYEKDSGTKVVLNFASSSTLAHQIVEGAPCDLFLSADEEWAEHVKAGGGAGWDPPEVVLTNRLVVVLAESQRGLWTVPGDRRDSVRAAAALRNALVSSRNAVGGRIDRIAVGDPEHVPAGRYAKRGLENLGVWENCRERLVPCESVKAALALVQRGEADAGIVYTTDAKVTSLPMVESGLPWGHDEGVFLTSEDLMSEVAEFPGVEARVMALVPREEGAAGRRFLAWLRGPEPTVLFRAAGFGIPGEER